MSVITHAADGNTEAQKVQVTCPKSQLAGTGAGIWNQAVGSVEPEVFP